MNYIGSKIEEIINKYKIDTIVCEDQFKGQNIQTLIKLRKLLGVVCRIAYEHNITPTYYLATTWRSILNINKGKEKDKKLSAYKYITDRGVNLGEFKDSGKKKNDDIAESIAMGMAYLKKNK